MGSTHHIPPWSHIEGAAGFLLSNYIHMCEYHGVGKEDSLFWYANLFSHLLIMVFLARGLRKVSVATVGLVVYLVCVTASSHHLLYLGN